MKKFKKISFVSEREMMDMVPWRNTALISITEPGRSTDVKGWKHVLRLQFHDISRNQDGSSIPVLSNLGDGSREYVRLKAFDAEQAIEVISFLDGLPIDVDSIVVHCHAGISRSAAVAEFIRREYSDIERLNKSIANMNSHVYSTLMEVFHSQE